MDTTSVVVMPIKERVFELDLLRFVAAVLVLLYHYTWRAQAIPGVDAPAFPLWINSWSRYGYLGVELFYFISGMVIFRSAANASARTFLISRVVRLFPAYWVLVTFSFLLVRLAGSPAGLGVSYRAYVFNLTMLQTYRGTDLVDGVYWTLAVELAFYAIVWITLAVGLGKNLFAVLAGWVAISIAMSVPAVHQQVPATVTTWGKTYLALPWAPYFVAGACCALLGGERRADTRVWTVLGASGIAAIWQGAHYTSHNVAPLYPPGSHSPVAAATAVAALLLIVFIVATGRASTLGRRWMVVAGALTYPLYLVHQNLGLVIFHTFDGVTRWALLGVAVVASVGVAWAVHKWVEQPFSPVLRRALRPTMPTAPST